MGWAPGGASGEPRRRERKPGGPGAGVGASSQPRAAGVGPAHLRSSACGGQGLRPGGWASGGRPPTRSQSLLSTATGGKKQAAKSKEELAQEKKKELERRLQDVSGQLSSSKKPARRGRAARGARAGGRQER